MAMLHGIIEQHQRLRRQAIELSLGSNKKVIKPRITINGNNNNDLSIWPDGSDRDVGSDGLKTANTILKDGRDLLGAPSRLLNSLQQNLVVSLVVIAVILVCVLIFYCLIQYHCSRGRKIFKKLPRSDKSATVPLSSRQVDEI